MKAAKPAREVNMHAASQRIEYIFFTFFPGFMWWAVLDLNQ